MTRKPRSVYSVHVNGNCTSNFTYDFDEANRAAHDLAYVHATRGAAYWSPTPGTYLVSHTHDLTTPAFIIEVVAEDDGIDL